jgi:hypothetical protein
LNWRHALRWALGLAFVDAVLGLLCLGWVSVYPEASAQLLNVYLRLHAPLAPWMETRVARHFSPDPHDWDWGHRVNYVATYLASVLNSAALGLVAGGAWAWVRGDRQPWQKAWFDHAVSAWLSGEGGLRSAHQELPSQARARAARVEALWSCLRRADTDWPELLLKRQAALKCWALAPDDADLLGSLGLATLRLERQATMRPDAAAEKMALRCIGRAWSLGLRSADFLEQCLALRAQDEAFLGAVETALAQVEPGHGSIRSRRLEQERAEGRPPEELLQRLQKEGRLPVEAQALQASWLQALGRRADADALWDKLLLLRPQDRALWRQALGAAEGDSARQQRLSVRLAAQGPERPGPGAWLLVTTPEGLGSRSQRGLVLAGVLLLSAVTAWAGARWVTPSEPGLGTWRCAGWILVDGAVMPADDTPIFIDSVLDEEGKDFEAFASERADLTLSLEKGGQARLSTEPSLALTWQAGADGFQLLQEGGRLWAQGRVAADGIELRLPGRVTSILLQQGDKPALEDRDQRWYVTPKTYMGAHGLFVLDVHGDLIKIRGAQKAAWVGIYAHTNPAPDPGLTKRPSLAIVDMQDPEKARAFFAQSAAIPYHVTKAGLAVKELYADNGTMPTDELPPTLRYLLPLLP